MDKQFLEAYKRQNPVKYAKKFGDLTLDEILAKYPTNNSAPVNSPIKVEITQAENVETTFAVEPTSKKRGRKPKK